AWDPGAWPFALPPVAQLLAEGLELAPGVTFLVGENGSGKSTLVEAIAEAAGLNPEGGSPNALHSTRRTESPLGSMLTLVRGHSARRWGYFLRAETMHGLYTYLESVGTGPRLHEMSHGESFLEVLTERFDQTGFYVMDEPEAALSFTSCLALVDLLARLATAGAQVVCATHSPLLTALPGATILELGEHGFAPVGWEDLALVQHWRGYLDDPRRYLRHVLEEDGRGADG
ncbi:ATPase AAA, partial [Actinotalea fermentans ATCC 43279 = JCM 9966 = DSM 3133]